MESLSFTNMTFQITAIILKPNCPKSKGPESFLLQSTRSPSVPWTPLQLDTEVFRPFSLTRECTTAISVFPHQGLLARQQNCVMLASEENNREKVLCWQIATGEMNYKYASRKNSCRKLCVGVGRTWDTGRNGDAPKGRRSARVCECSGCSQQRKAEAQTPPGPAGLLPIKLPNG